MQLRISENQLIPNPTITKPVDCDSLLQADHRYFDKDGYELNYQERLFHKNSGVVIDEGHLFHTANHVSWFYDKEESQNSSKFQVPQFAEKMLGNVTNMLISKGTEALTDYLKKGDAKTKR